MCSINSLSHTEACVALIFYFTDDASQDRARDNLLLSNREIIQRADERPFSPG